MHRSGPVVKPSDGWLQIRKSYDDIVALNISCHRGLVLRLFARCGVLVGGMLRGLGVTYPDLWKLLDDGLRRRPKVRGNEEMRAG